MTNTKDDILIENLCKIVGHKHVITSEKRMERFCRGYRSGKGHALAVVRPGTLTEQWHALQACVIENKIIIMQAANTGLTEGSTPSGHYDREVIIISTNRMDQIQLINEGRQIISFPGATLFSLEKKLARIGRQAHSVIGSSCIGASITGGVCNSSGGSLIERGPAYTELSLYAKVNSSGKLELINDLGIKLGNNPEEILTRLENGDFNETDITASRGKASDSEYHLKVRQINENTPARFNADTSRLYGASGCAGKLAVFALRLDTFPTNTKEQTFYIGTLETETLTQIRKDMLKNFNTLPVSAEYMHKDCYDITKLYGKDTVILIEKLGTDKLPIFFAIKGWLDTYLNKSKFIPNNLVDKLLQTLSHFWPNVLPRRMETFRKRFPHHLILKTHGEGIEETKSYLKTHFDEKKLGFFICSDRETKIANLHRFAAAGAAIRYMALNNSKVADIIALDIALRRNDNRWFEKLPSEIEEALSQKLYYGHFFCHVLHQDYVVKKGYDPKAIKKQMLEILDTRGAKYPAEHNVGHLYQAEDGLAEFYRFCDPTNSFNPGIGGTSKRRNYS